MTKRKSLSKVFQQAKGGEPVPFQEKPCLGDLSEIFEDALLPLFFLLNPLVDYLLHVAFSTDHFDFCAQLAMPQYVLIGYM